MGFFSKVWDLATSAYDSVTWAVGEVYHRTVDYLPKLPWDIANAATSAYNNLWDIKNNPLDYIPFVSPVKWKINDFKNIDASWYDLSLDNIQKDVNNSSKDITAMDQLWNVWEDLWTMFNQKADQFVSYWTDQLNIWELNKEYRKKSKWFSDQAVINAKAKVQKQIDNNLITKDQGNDLLKQEYLKEYNKLSDTYLSTQNIKGKLWLNDEELKKEFKKWETLTSLYSKLSSTKVDNKKAIQLNKLNVDLKVENKHFFDITWSEKNVMNAKDIKTLWAIEDMTNSRQATVRILMADNLVWVEKWSSDYNNIIDNSNKLLKAKLHLWVLNSDLYKEYRIKFPSKTANEISHLAADEAQKRLSLLDNSILHEQDALVSNNDYYSSLNKLTHSFSKDSNSYGEKASMWGQALKNTLIYWLAAWWQLISNWWDILWTTDNIFLPRLIEWKDARSQAKTFSDNYEYSIINESALVKWLNHILRNPDDIAEVAWTAMKNPVSLFWKIPKILWIVKKLENLSDALKDATKNSKAIQFAIWKSAHPLIRVPTKLAINTLKAVWNAKQVVNDIWQWAFINQVINRNMMMANNESNIWLNMMFDALWGRAFSWLGHSLGYGFNASDTASAWLFLWKDFRTLSRDLAEEKKISEEAAWSLINQYKWIMKDLSEPLVDGKDFYDTVRSVELDTVNGGKIAADNGNIVFLDNIKNKYKALKWNKTNTYFEWWINTASQYDTDLVVSMHKKTLDSIILMWWTKNISV